MPWNDQDDDNKNSGPWGSRPGNGSGGGSGGNDGGDNPWGKGGGRRRGGGPEGADIDEVLQQIQNRMRNALPGGGEGGKGLVFLIVLLLGLWLATGFYRVLPEEHGVILTFGQWTRTQMEPGLGYHLPWPVQSLYKPNVTQQRRIEIGYRSTDSRGGEKVTDIPSESLMLTGDENIIDIDFVVVWQVMNARDYLFEIRDPQATIKKVAESAVREVIGQTPIQPALTEARQDIESRTLNKMQELLNSYQAGVRVVRVQLQKVDPPSQVIDEFNEVQRARADRERLRNEAETYRNDIIPRARGEAERMVQEAMAYREQIVNQAEGETNRFNAVREAYSKAKEVTIHRIWLETMQDVIGRSNTILVDGQSSGGVLPYLPLNELKKRAGKSLPPQPSGYPQTTQR